MPVVRVGPGGRETVEAAVLDALDEVTAVRVLREGRRALPQGAAGPERHPGALGQTGRRGQSLDPGVVDPRLAFQQSPSRPLVRWPTSREALVGTGATLGGALGSGLGSVAALPGPGTVMGGMLGAGTGALAGDQLADWLSGRARGSVTDEATRAALTAGTAAAGQLAGEGLGRVVVGPVARAAGRGLQRVTPIGVYRALGLEAPRVAAARAEVEAATAARREAAREAHAAGATAVTAERVAQRARERFGTRMGTAETRAAALREAQAAHATAEHAARTLLADLGGGRAADRLATGTAVQTGVDRALATFRAANARAYGAIEALAGDAPVVATTHLDAAVQRLATEATGTARAAPPFVTRLLREGPDASLIGGVATNPADPYQAALLKAVHEALAAATEGRQIAFATARQVQAQLGEVAFRGGATIGTLTQGQAKVLYRAVSQDLDAFLATREGLPAALAEANQAYRTGKTLLTSTLVRSLKTHPDRVFEAIFQPGAPSRTLDFQALLLPLGEEGQQLYRQAVTGWLARAFERAMRPAPTGGRVFSPSRFVAELEPFRREGALATLLDEGAAQRLTTLLDHFASLGGREGAETLVRTGAGARGVSAAQAAARAAAREVPAREATSDAARAAATTAATRAVATRATEAAAAGRLAAVGGPAVGERALTHYEVDRLLLATLGGVAGYQHDGAGGAAVGAAAGGLVGVAAVRTGGRALLTRPWTGRYPSAALRWAAAIVAQEQVPAAPSTNP